MANELTQAEVLEAFDIDFDTGDVSWRTPPRTHPRLAGRTAGSLCVGKGKNKDYWQICFRGKVYKRSRLVFFAYHGRWPSPVVDHADGCSTNDRISNLRECSRSFNNINISKPQGGRDLPRGVTRTPQGGFMARFRSKSLGVFDTPESAASAYRTAKEGEMHGIS